jgi:hypothetical protein
MALVINGVKTWATDWRPLKSITVFLPSGERVSLSGGSLHGFFRVAMQSGWLRRKNLPRTGTGLRRACTLGAPEPKPIPRVPRIRRGV